MKTVSLEGGRALVELTCDDVATMNNALNQVCNGIHLEGEFDTRMGCSVEEAKGLLAKINRLGELMKGSN